MGLYNNTMSVNNFKNTAPLPPVAITPSTTTCSSHLKYVDHTYRDYSRYVEEGGELIKHKKSTNNFPARLHLMLSNAEAEHSDVITWMPHGRAWKILDRKRLISDVIPNYYVCKKYESFSRQLNGWGFKRLHQSGPDFACYYHESFLRDMPELTCLIRRLPPNLGKSTPYAEGEPNFYLISEEYPLPPPPRNDTSNDTNSSKARALSLDSRSSNVSFANNNNEQQAPPPAPFSSSREVSPLDDFTGKIQYDFTLPSSAASPTYFQDIMIEHQLLNKGGVPPKHVARASSTPESLYNSTYPPNNAAAAAAASAGNSGYYHRSTSNSNQGGGGYSCNTLPYPSTYGSYFNVNHHEPYYGHPNINNGLEMYSPAVGQQQYHHPAAADVAGNMPSFHFPTLPNEIVPSANNNATGSHHPPSVDQIAPIMHRPEFVSRARTYPQQLQQQPPPQVYPGSTSLGVVSHPSQAKASSTTVVNCLAHPGSDSCAHGPTTTVVVSQDPFAPIPLSRSFSEKQQDDSIGIEENAKVV